MTVITADWHLGKRQYSLYRREQDFYIAAKNLIESLEEDSIIFNAGDIFDVAKPKFEAIKVLKEIDENLKAKNSVMFYIEGNHDRAPLTNDTSGLEHWTDLFKSQEGVFKGVYHLKNGQPIVYKNYQIIAFCEQPKEDLITALNNLQYTELNKNKDKTNILMLHMSCKEFASFCSDKTLEFKDIPNIDFWDYIIIGDTHVHSVKQITKSNNKDVVNILSPGSIEMVSSSEDPEKKVFILENNQLTSKPIKTRLCKKVVLSEDIIADDVIEELKTIKDKHPLLYLEVPSTIIGLSRIMNIFNLDQAIIRTKFFKIKEDKLYKVDYESSDEVMSLNDFFNKYFKEKNQITLNTKLLNIVETLITDKEIDVAELLTNTNKNNDTPCLENKNN
jgi:DNA repair exonuclease SbcCD nuclease subunit